MTISLVTAVYNNASCIEQCLRSVCNQSFQGFEYIVIDGGSTDGTLDILDSYRSRIDRMRSEPDSGIYDALNKGIRLATGEYIGFLHSDDLFAGTEVLDRLSKRLQQRATDSIYGDLQYVERKDPRQVVRYWKAGHFSQRKLRWGWMPPHPTFYVRRDVYAKHGLFNTGLRIAADYDLLLRLLGRAQITTQYLPGVLVNMRTGGTSNQSIANLVHKMREDYCALRSNQIGGAWTLAGKNGRKLGQLWRRAPTPDQQIDENCHA